MNKKTLSQLFFSVLVFSSCLAYAGKEGEESKEKTEQKVEDNQNAESLERPVSQDQAQQNGDNVATSSQDVKSDQKKEESEQKPLVQNPIPQKASSVLQAQNIVPGNLDTKKEFANLIQSPHFLLNVASFLKDPQDFISLAQTNRAISRVILSDAKENLIPELKNRLNPEHPGQTSSFNLFRGSLMARHHFLIPTPDFFDELSGKKTSFSAICKRSALVLSLCDDDPIDLQLLSDTDYSAERQVNYVQKIADLGLPLATSEVALLENKILLPQIVQFVCTLGCQGILAEGIYSLSGVETNIKKIIEIVNQNNIQVSLELIKPSQAQIPLLQEFFKTKKIAELQADYKDLVDDNGCRFDLSFVRSFRIARRSQAELEQVLPFLSEQAKHLQILDIGELMTDEQFYDAIEQFSQISPRFPHLQELKCPFFDEEDLDSDPFFRLFPSNLKHLNLGLNHGLTAAQVKSAVDRFERLQSLGFILGTPDATTDYRKHIVACMQNFSKYSRSLMHLEVTFYIPPLKRVGEIRKILMSEQSATKTWLFSDIETLKFHDAVPYFYNPNSGSFSEPGIYNFGSLENVKTIVELCNPKALRKISLDSSLFAENLPFLEKMLESLPSKVLLVCEEEIFLSRERWKEPEERKIFYNELLEKYPRLTAQMKIDGRTFAEYFSTALRLK